MVVDVLIVIVGVTNWLTVTCIELEVIVTGVAQLALDVNSHEITSLLAKVVVAYVLLLVPTFVPFFFHW